MKNSSKFVLGVGIAAAVGAFVAGVVHELKTIKKLTTDIDEIPEEEVPTEAVEETAEEAVEEAVEEVVEEAPVEEAATEEEVQ